jgi:hypothetical protein
VKIFPNKPIHWSWDNGMGKWYKMMRYTTHDNDKP